MPNMGLCSKFSKRPWLCSPILASFSYWSLLTNSQKTIPNWHSGPSRLWGSSSSSLCSLSSSAKQKGDAQCPNLSCVSFPHPWNAGTSQDIQFQPFRWFSTTRGHQVSLVTYFTMYPPKQLLRTVPVVSKHFSGNEITRSPAFEGGGKRKSHTRNRKNQV